MKYGLIILIGSIAAFVSLRRLHKKATVRPETLGAVSHGWLMRQRSEGQ